MKRVTLLLILVFLAQIGFAQSRLVESSELSFNSELEEATIERYIVSKESIDYLSLFLAIDPGQDAEDLAKAKQDYQKVLNELNNTKTLKKRPEKKVKAIYEKIHDAFFDQYLEQNLFSEIFINGKYNCVSATALYGIYFDALNIPFSVKEKPTHVYIVTYPNAEQILVESTDPLGGYVRFSENNKEALVERLARAKMISSNEMKSMSTDQLFSKYYLSDESIDLQSLIGLQYLNDAIYKMNETQVEKAFEQAQKAWFFYPSVRTENLLLATCLEYLINQDYSDAEAINYLIQLTRFTELDQDFIVSEYSRMLSILLIEKNNTSLLESNYNHLVKNIHDDKLKNDLSYLYNYERGRALYNQAKYTDALPYFEQAYSIKPNNLDISTVLINSIGKTLISVSNTEAIQELERYNKEFPQLADNNFFLSMLANGYLLQFGQAFELNKEKEGLTYKALFEKYYDPELAIDQNNLGRAYSLSAVYYFRKGYTKKAKQLLNEGLNMSPHNHELNSRKRMIK